MVAAAAAVTSLQMRRNLAAKGHTQGHTAGEGPQWDSHQTLLLALSLGSFLPALHSQWGGGERGGLCPQVVKFGSWRWKIKPNLLFFMDKALYRYIDISMYIYICVCI